MEGMENHFFRGKLYSAIYHQSVQFYLSTAPNANSNVNQADHIYGTGRVFLGGGRSGSLKELLLQETIGILPSKNTYLCQIWSIFSVHALSKCSALTTLFGYV